MKTGFVEITKIESAKEQLVTAINLYFSGNSQVSVHTLIRASHEILDVLCEKQKLERGVLQQGSEWIKPEMKKIFWSKIVEAKNFFKHADDGSDPQTKIEWNPDVSRLYILDAVSLYSRLTNNTLPCEMSAFKIWFRINNPDLWDKKIPDIDAAFEQAKTLLYGYSDKNAYELLIEACKNGGFNNKTIEPRKLP